MFDLAQDLPSREDPPPPLTTPSATTEPSTTNNQARKRKRALTAAAELTEQLRSKRATTGAGSRIPDAELGGGLGARTFKAYTNPVGISDNDNDNEDDDDGAPPAAREIEFAGFDDTTGAEDDDDDEDDSDDSDDNDDDDDDAMDFDVVGPDAHALHRFRRDGDDDSSALPTAAAAAAAGKPVPAKRPPFYMTNRYRPILGVVALGDDDDEHDDEEFETQGKKHRTAIEVALVERPVWDLELPPRFHSGKEYGR